MKEKKIIRSIITGWYWNGQRFDDAIGAAKIYGEWDLQFRITDDLKKATKICPCELVTVYFNDTEQA